MRRVTLMLAAMAMMVSLFAVVAYAAEIGVPVNTMTSPRPTKTTRSSAAKVTTNLTASAKIMRVIRTRWKGIVTTTL